jgi:hypothetical protein
MDKGGMSASAGTRRFEFAAESVLELDAGERDAHERVEVTVKIAKNRHGAPGAVCKLTFEGALQRFTEGR